MVWQTHLARPGGQQFLPVVRPCQRHNQPNAGGEPHPEAGATDERTLEGVGCSAWLGDAWEMPVPISRASGAENHVCLWINRLALTVTTLHHDLVEADRLQHHHKLMLVI